MLNKYSWASLIWAIMSALATSIPGKFIPRITGTANLILDNTSHFVIFLVLSFLLTRGFAFGNKPLPYSKSMAYSFLISIFYGFTLEILQIPLPERAFEWSDALANTIGAAFGIIIAGIWRRPNERK